MAPDDEGSSRFSILTLTPPCPYCLEHVQLTRRVRFKDGPEVREEIQAFKPCIVSRRPARPRSSSGPSDADRGEPRYMAHTHDARPQVYFEMTPLDPPSSSSSAPPSPVWITNLISHSPTNEPLLTFSFAPRMPHLPDEVIREKGWGDEDVNREIGRGVQRTVDVIREMVRNGEIQ